MVIRFSFAPYPFKFKAMRVQKCWLGSALSTSKEPDADIPKKTESLIAHLTVSKGWQTGGKKRGQKEGRRVSPLWHREQVLYLTRLQSPVLYDKRVCSNHP